jgi:copper chaperone CopZ
MAWMGMPMEGRMPGMATNEQIDALNVAEGESATIEMEIGELTGVKSVSANEVSKQVVIDWESPATWDEINGTLQEIGYPPQQLIQL